MTRDESINKLNMNLHNAILKSYKNKNQYGNLYGEIGDEYSYYGCRHWLIKLKSNELLFDLSKMDIINQSIGSLIDEKNIKPCEDANTVISCNGLKMHKFNNFYINEKYYNLLIKGNNFTFKTNDTMLFCYKNDELVVIIATIKRLK